MYNTPEKTPSLAFRKTVTRLSLITLLQIVVFQLFGGIMQAIMIVIYALSTGNFDAVVITDPEKITEIVNSLYSRYPYSILMMLPYIFSFAVVYGIYAHVKRLPVKSAFGRGKISPLAILSALMLFLGVSAVSDYVSRIFSFLLDIAGLASYPLPSMTHAGIANIISVSVQIVILPALLEEFAFRGVALMELAPYGRKSAVLISALLFSLMHATAIQIPTAFLLGVLMAYLVLKTDSIWIAVFIHGINNALSITLEYLVNKNANLRWLLEDGLQMELLNLAFLAVGVAGFFLMRKIKGHTPKEEYAPSGAKALFTSWGFYLLFVSLLFLTSFSLRKA